MARLVYVESSPRKERSSSIRVASAFLDAYRAAHAGDDVETLDLWSLGLPEFDGATIAAKYSLLGGQAHSPEEARAWSEVVAVFERFARGDKYLFSVPMWNFGIPYKLKQFIDVITQPGLAFTVEPGVGFKGLLAGRPGVVIYARSGRYGEAPGPEQGDYQSSYFDFLLRFIGIGPVERIFVEPTQGRPDKVEAMKQQAEARAAELAKAF